MSIALVTDQHAITASSASADTIVVALPNNAAAGSLVVLAIQYHSNVSVSGVSDGTTSGVIAGSRYLGDEGNYHEIWYCQNHPGGTKSFTVTLSAASTYRGVVIAEFSGVATSSAQEGYNAATGNGTTGTSGNVSPAPTVDGELLIGNMYGGTPTWSGGFAALDYNSSVGNGAGYYVQPSVTAIAATWTQASGPYAGQAASFKPAAGGPSAGLLAAIADELEEG